MSRTKVQTKNIETQEVDSNDETEHLWGSDYSEDQSEYEEEDTRQNTQVQENKIVNDTQKDTKQNTQVQEKKIVNDTQIKPKSFHNSQFSSKVKENKTESNLFYIPRFVKSFSQDEKYGNSQLKGNVLSSDTVKRSRLKLQETKKKKIPTRIGKAMYIATANNGQYGIIDKVEESEGCSILLVHVPKKHQHTELDLHPGDVLTLKGKIRTVQETRVQIQFVGRSQYFSPSRSITSCTIGVASTEWKMFLWTQTQ